MGGYLGIDLSGAGMAVALWHRGGAAVTPIAVPSGALFMAGADRLGLGDWALRGLKLAIPSGRSPRLCYTEQHYVALDTLRARLTQQLIPLPAAIATAAAGDGQPLRGVILTMPPVRRDCYCLNLREVVLGANLVQSPDQVFFVETAIAALLASLPSPSGPWPLGRSPSPGKTLVIHTGPWSTELGLVDLASDWESRSRLARHLTSFAYGEQAIGQDILCQMFYAALPPVDRSGLTLPLPGQPDEVARDRLQQGLQSTPLGRRLLHLAEHLKRAFNHPSPLEFRINGVVRTVGPDDFHRAVLGHYLRRLHQKINLALGTANWAPGEVQQVVCSGALATMAAIAQWWPQQFPQAQVVGLAAGTPNAALAAGLACLPRYPQLLDATDHQYNDLFLLREMLRVLPPPPLSFARILQLLEQGGINTGMCHRSILRLLEGQLPGGLVAAPEDAALITGAGEPLTTPLFRKHETHYQMDGAVRDRLQSHLTDILTATHQTLVDPLSLWSLADG